MTHRYMLRTPRKSVVPKRSTKPHAVALKDLDASHFTSFATAIAKQREKEHLEALLLTAIPMTANIVNYLIKHIANTGVAYVVFPEIKDKDIPPHGSAKEPELHETIYALLTILNYCVWFPRKSTDRTDAIVSLPHINAPDLADTEGMAYELVDFSVLRISTDRIRHLKHVAANIVVHLEPCIALEILLPSIVDQDDSSSDSSPDFAPPSPSESDISFGSGTDSDVDSESS